MSGPARRRRGVRASVALRSRLDRIATTAFGAAYCLGSVYVVAPVGPAEVLADLHVACEARRVVREFEQLLAGHA